MRWLHLDEKGFVVLVVLMIPIALVAVWWQTRDTRGKRVAFEFPFVIRVPWLWRVAFHDEHVLVLNHERADLVLMRVPGNSAEALQRFLADHMPNLPIVLGPVLDQVWRFELGGTSGAIRMLGPGAFVLLSGGDEEFRAEIDRDLQASRPRMPGDKAQRWLISKTSADSRYLPPASRIAS